MRPHLYPVPSESVKREERDTRLVLCADCHGEGTRPLDDPELPGVVACKRCGMRGVYTEEIGSVLETTEGGW